MFESDPIVLLQTYGYWALLIGTFLEGETIVIIAGLLAQQGYLEPWLIALCAFVGSCSSDQIMFALGRWKGLAIIQRFPKLERNVCKATNLLARYETALILGFRFLYGVRNVTPILMGVSRVNYAKFVILNLVGGAVWAVSFTAGGYFFGEVITTLLDKNPNAKYWALGGLAAIIAAFWIRRQLKARKRAKDPDCDISEALNPAAKERTVDPQRKEE